MKLSYKDKGIAVWLIKNTELTFQQIADFCQMMLPEIKALADNEDFAKVVGQDPVVAGFLTKDEIIRCEGDPRATLNPRQLWMETKKKTKKHVPRERRIDRPGSIVWFLKHYPQIKDQDIAFVLGSTKKTVMQTREKIKLNQEVPEMRNPVISMLCSKDELFELLNKYSIKDAFDRSPSHILIKKCDS